MWIVFFLNLDCPKNEVLTDFLCNNTNNFYNTIAFLKKKIYFCERNVVLWYKEFKPCI